MTGVSVGRLWQYPVKSMQGEEVEQILLGPGGVAGDRAYGFVDVETGRLASAKRPRRFGALLDKDVHQAAVRDALAFVEEHALFTRTGPQGIRQVNVRGPPRL